MAGVLDYTPALSTSGTPDDTESTLAGVLNGRIKVYVDPYSANIADDHYYVMGYKGSSAYDAGLFYCPYVPLQMVRSIGQDTFNLRSALRLVTVWLLTHSLVAPLSAPAPSPLTITSSTIVVLAFSTSCDPFSQGYTGGSSDPLFCLNS